MRAMFLVLILLASSAQAQVYVSPYSTSSGFVAGHMRGVNDGFEGNNMNYRVPVARPIEITPPSIPQLNVNSYSVDPETGVIEVE